MDQNHSIDEAHLQTFICDVLAEKNAILQHTILSDADRHRLLQLDELLQSLGAILPPDESAAASA